MAADTAAGPVENDQFQGEEIVKTPAELFDDAWHQITMVWGAVLALPEPESHAERYTLGFFSGRKAAAMEIVAHLTKLKMARVDPMYDRDHRRLRICDVCLEKLCPGDDAEMITISSMFGPCMVCGDPKPGHSYISRFGGMPKARAGSSLPNPQGVGGPAAVSSSPTAEEREGEGEER